MAVLDRIDLNYLELKRDHVIRETPRGLFTIRAMGIMGMVWSSCSMLHPLSKSPRYIYYILCEKIWHRSFAQAFLPVQHAPIQFD